MPKFQPKNSAEGDSREPETVLEIEKRSVKKSPSVSVKPKESDPLEVFTSQFEIKELPSLFKPYPDGVRIIVNTYSYREIKIFSDSRIPTDKLYEIMLRGIHVEGMDPLLLTYFDFVYIGVLRRLSSMGAQRFMAPYYCPQCNRDGVHYFDLTEVGFKSIDAPDIPINVAFRSLGEHRFSPLSVGDYMELYRQGKLYETDASGDVILKTNGKEIVNSISVLAMMALDVEFEDAYKIFDDVRDPKDREVLLKIDDLMDHGIEPLTFECRNRIEKAKPGTHPSEIKTCNRKLFLDLAGGESLIHPFREHGEDDEPRISFGFEGSSEPLRNSQT